MKDIILSNCDFQFVCTQTKKGWFCDKILIIVKIIWSEWADDNTGSSATKYVKKY